MMALFYTNLFIYLVFDTNILESTETNKSKSNSIISRRAKKKTLIKIINSTVGYMKMFHTTLTVSHIMMVIRSVKKTTYQPLLTNRH